MVLKNKNHKYCVVGNPITQSLSPKLHKLFAAQTGEPIEYDKVLIELDDFERHMRELIAQGYQGFNITAPFKEQAYRLVDVAAEDTHFAAALNTIKVEDDGTLSGYSTDGFGLVNDLQNNLSIALEGKKVLLLGAGGAAKSVLQDLMDAGALLSIANRTASKAYALAQRLAINGYGFGEVEGYFDLVINGTSASLEGASLDLPGVQVDADSLCYEMAYNKGGSPFLKWALHSGARVQDGLGMLVEQGAKSFEIWRGVAPDTKFALDNI